MATASTVVSFTDKEIKDLLFAEAKRRLPNGVESGSQTIKIMSDQLANGGGEIAASISFTMTLKPPKE